MSVPPSVCPSRISSQPVIFIHKKFGGKVGTMNPLECSVLTRSTLTLRRGGAGPSEVVSD